MLFYRDLTFDNGNKESNGFCYRYPSENKKRPKVFGWDWCGGYVNNAIGDQAYKQNKNPTNGQDLAPDWQLEETT